MCSKFHYPSLKQLSLASANVLEGWPKCRRSWMLILILMNKYNYPSVRVSGIEIILYSTFFLLFLCHEHLLMVSEQHLITAPGKNYLRVHEASYLASQSRPRVNSHFSCGWTSSNVHLDVQDILGKVSISCLSAFLTVSRSWQSLNSLSQSNVSLAMIAALAIYDNEEVNEGAAENLCHPLGNSLDKSVARTVTSFLHFGCWSPLIGSIYRNKRKTFIFHEDPTDELASFPLQWGFCLEKEGK